MGKKIITHSNGVVETRETFYTEETVNQLKQQLAEKDKEIERLKERLSVFDNFKDNYGYTNYDDSEILEDLQSRAFQGEDDTAVIESLFEFFDICDENEILPKVEEISEKLKCAIVPRFKKGDTAYAIMDTTLYTDVFKVNILDTELCYKVDRGDNDISTQHYTRLFSNEQEAQAKLQELRGGE